MKRSILSAAIAVSLLGLAHSSLAYDFPEPNKSVPFTEDGVDFTYQIEYLSNKNVFYVAYCRVPPGGVEYLGLTRAYQRGWKIVPFMNGCQQYKYINGTWVSTSDNTWYRYIAPSECLSDVIRSTSDVYWSASTSDYNFGASYCNIGNVISGEVLVEANVTAEPPPPPDTPFGFVLNGYTPYTAPVSSVMDQSTLGSGPAYGAGEDGIIESFEGEIGNVGPHAGSTCYRKYDSSVFGININYVGSYLHGGATYLCYDAHPGYDYPMPRWTDIHAPESGTLCVATSYTNVRMPPDVWRDVTKCDTPNAVITTWEGFHTFYILHDDLQINGEVGKYMSVFLHNDDLSPTVRSAVEQNGYATVTKGDHIAEVGGYGPDGPETFGNHVHMEMYKYNETTTDWDRVDPYGDGTNNILWEQ